MNVERPTSNVQRRSKDLTLPIASLILVIATLLAFWPVLSFDFTTWDDYETIARNRRMNTGSTADLRTMWTTPHMDLYIPVTQTVWFFTANAARKPLAPREQITEKTIFLDARVFHGLNLALHVAAAIVAMILLRRLLDNSLAALLGALLFALHPLQVESVAWVSGTKDVLFALLVLVALWQYVEYARSKADGGTLMASEQWRMLGVATLAFILAMLSKPTAIVTPLLACVIDRLLLGRSWRDVLRTVWPWFVLAVPCVIWTWMVQPAHLSVEQAPPVLLRPLIALDAMAFYLAKLVWPATLIFDYGRTPKVVLESRAIAWTWILPVVLAGGALWLARRRDQRVPAAAMFVFAIVLLPVLGLVPFDFQAYSTVADHYMYLAMLGPALLVAWIASKRPSTSTVIAIAAVACAFAIRTHAQTHHWRNSESLFTHALAHNPRSFASLGSLGTIALERGDINAAIDLSRRALDIRPQYSTSFMTLAEAMRIKGDTAQAIALYRRALQFEPDFGPALGNIAALLAEQGDLAAALPYGERAATVQQDNIPAQLNLGRMYYQLNRPADARRQFQKVLQLDPQNQPARELLSTLP